MDKIGRRVLFWAPRILGILFIFFISLLALDIFDMDLSAWETIVGLFMHLIPSMIMVIVLVVAWRWEWLGAIGFGIIGILWTIRSWGDTLKMNWFLPGFLFLISILFFIDWMLKRRKITHP